MVLLFSDSNKFTLIVQNDKNTDLSDLWNLIKAKKVAQRTFYYFIFNTVCPIFKGDLC
jgi:hypothetical protein